MGGTNIGQAVNTATQVLSLGTTSYDPSNNSIGPGVITTGVEQAYSKLSGQDAANDAAFQAQQVQKAENAQANQVAAQAAQNYNNAVSASTTAQATRNSAATQSVGALGFSAATTMPPSNPASEFLGL